MSSAKRRADARRRAWGRGPIILRFEPLESRHLLATTSTALPDLVSQSFQAPSSLTWGQSFEVSGVVANNGAAAVTVPIQVEIYASPSMGVAAGSGAEGIGTVTIPAGLQPGSTASFNQQVTLPVTPLNGVGTPGSLYVGMAIDPNNQIAESNPQSNAGVGLGIDTSLVTIAAPPVASLVGTGIQLSTTETSWGGEFMVTETIANTGNAPSPATTALVVLTPAGVAEGSGSDVTIGNISVPVIAAGQTTTVSQTITLPESTPVLLTGSSTFTLSITQDADYLTNQIYPHLATQGIGLDQANVTIDTPAYSPGPATSLPDLSVSGVTTSKANIQWGQTVQVSATIGNTGSADSGQVRVRFILVGTNGTTNGLFLDDAILSNLAAGSSYPISQSIQLPAVPPSGVGMQGQGTIAIELDPEHTFDQSSYATSTAFSNIFNIGNTPTAPTATPTSTTVAAPTAPTAAELAAAAKRSAAEAAAKARHSAAEAAAAARRSAAAARRAALLAARKNGGHSLG